MPIMRDPLDRKRRLVFNAYEAGLDYVDENAISQKKQFRDLPAVSQLTQNSWNLSPKTREDVFKDVTIYPTRAERRTERYKTPQRPEKYGDHRW